MKNKLAAELARLETEHGHEWRGILQEQFGRLVDQIEHAGRKTTGKETASTAQD